MAAPCAASQFAANHVRERWACDWSADRGGASSTIRPGAEGRGLAPTTCVPIPPPVGGLDVRSGAAASRWAERVCSAAAIPPIIPRASDAPAPSATHPYDARSARDAMRLPLSPQPTPDAGDRRADGRT